MSCDNASQEHGAEENLVREGKAFTHIRGPCVSGCIKNLNHPPCAHKLRSRILHLTASHGTSSRCYTTCVGLIQSIAIAREWVICLTLKRDWSKSQDKFWCKWVHNKWWVQGTFGHWFPVDVRVRTTQVASLSSTEEGERERENQPETKREGGERE